MGCTDLVPWERYAKDPYLVQNQAQNEDQNSALNLIPNSILNYNQNSVHTDIQEYPFFALETGGTGIAQFPFPRWAVMIVGSEELGVSAQGLAAADASLGRVSIPSYGAKGSLNVSVAFGIVMHAWAAALSLERSS
jgi:tRNA G18 (ribose-2'-O)-methylase SpoU